ncbi:SusC/RagA family TonB-linked outer membrane protein [Pedobacter sp. ISL-68]|uniref:SusC/RagA family TonB-linked outer membrane protein n=1 Tax=unclassified Pedobacter TaxID=2628915 RepID=UPI001BEA32CE|nr:MULTISPECIES: SusC/RagA family TonB-linked outer membrane protein [unclassified Pedobacter]MBT2562077.1 SusC/RagA family TonB-linked outer membrane protein [Pedobacter sp. ISL-64]MBT2591664.1 SusC/RagA family TonB-linked outer membrane protein [Pedobacter sp. ISL-68]
MIKNFTQQISWYECVLHVKRSNPDNHKESKPFFKGKLKRFSVLVFAAVIQLICINYSFAQTAVQNVVIKGTVLDDEDGQTLIGTTITDKNKKFLAVTNEKGNYSITVAKGATVLYNMVGYKTLSKVFNTNDNNAVVRLQSSTSSLNDVVVTALGIKREEKALGYATTKLDSNEFTNAVASNWTDALSGKVAGLNLIRNSGPAASNKIILRGENNLTGDNEALIVIDGVVASSSTRRTAASSGGVYGTSGDIMPPDFGSALNDLNPDDIESVTVLKGPGASALYGQRGANGAIIITTKSGNKSRKKLSITFTSNSTWEKVNKSPEIQSEFGQGQFGVNYFSYGASDDGASTNATSASWGAPFNQGTSFFQYDPATKTRGTTRTPWVAYGNPVDAFFQTGFESSNAVSLDGTYKGVAMRFSASHGNNEWIVPNTGLERTSLSYSANSDVTKKLNIQFKAIYNNRHSDNLPATGYGNQSLMYWFMFAQPNVNTDWYKDYWANGRVNEQFVNITTTNPESPYAISEQYLNKQRRNGLLGSLQATYKLTKELSLLVRGSVDYNHDVRDTQRPYDAAGNKFAQGSYRQQNINSYEINADFLLRYNKKISPSIQMNATVGGSQMRNEYKKGELRADGLVIPGIYSLTNNANPLISVPDTARYRINSFYSLLSFSFKNYLYLDITGRQDWNSTLATPFRTDNVGFFYPSASASFVPSDLWEMPKFISFFKLRASISQVGSGGTTPYRTAYNYSLASNGIYPDSAMTNPSILPNPNLKPLKTTTIELGTELRLFKNRLNFDFAAYSGNTKNQILSRIVDRATGYNVAVFNVGEVQNKGLEVSISGTLLQTKKFKWQLNGTFTANRNKIIELADSSVVLRTGALGGGQIVANVGGSMGDLYGRGFVRSPDGQIVYDATTGNAKTGTDLIYLGNTTPKFRFSFGTTITYDRFTVSGLFDAQLGAVAHSLTFSRMAALGKLALTLPGRYNGVVGDGVVQNTDGTYRTNDIVATNLENFYTSIYGSDQAEGSIFRTDYLKFREANITYSFGPMFLRKIGFTKLTLGAYGRNLFIWSPWPAFDPEFGTLSGTDIVQGFETGQLPSTRSYGVRLVVGL